MMTGIHSLEGNAVKIALLAGILLAVLAGGEVLGWGTEEVGPDRADRPTVSQPDWPKGIVDLPRHPSRVYSMGVNGNEIFYFDASVEQTNELLAAFGRARMRDHVIRIVSGGSPARSFGEKEYKYNVSLQVVSGIAMSVAREEKESKLPLEPQLTILAGDNPCALEQLAWPEHAIVECSIPGLPLASKRARPERIAFYGRLAFDDGRPAVDFVRNVSTRITLWEEGNNNGITVAKVNHEGFFLVQLSADELTPLAEGKMWLTVTCGNHLAEARPKDTEYPVVRLSVEKNNARVLTVKSPTSFWGRILFEDGSAPVLRPEPWSGAKIMVDFPYAGSVCPDEQGYFKVVLTQEQVETITKQEVRKNIYIPQERPGASTAMLAYPASMLSQKKSEAGVVKIPLLYVMPRDCRPEYESSVQIKE
ncbi:MAG: hypothetical protein IH624_04145 [Phycisphaerae bacterium]|nr:hypothetical protein [Phycisphaerae bacterium]